MNASLTLPLYWASGVEYYIIDRLSELLETLDKYKVNGPLRNEMINHLFKRSTIT